MIGNILYWAGFGLLCVPVLLGPWLFGAWEMWWFWPLATLLAVSTACFALRLLLPGGATPGQPRATGRRLVWLALSYLPFLLYAVFRAVQTPVRMDAERSVLLFFTPYLVALHVAFGLRDRDRRLLWTILVANLLLLVFYGLANHAACGSRWVLWVEGYPQYVSEHRASGSYFCPDHYAGLCELLVAVCLGLLGARRATTATRLMAGIGALAGTVGVVLSKSRGGGLTLVVLGACALVWGMNQWPRAVRWYVRAMLLSGAGLLVAFALPLLRPYAERFGSYVDTGSGGMHWSERVERVEASWARKPRGRMIGAALRAWQTSPWIGVGPGMHQTLWPRFAATADGDRATHTWPSQTNHDFYSYEVHSDWVQLLQEYGILGVLLFLLPCLFGVGLLLQATHTERQRCREAHWVNPANPYHAWVLGGLLCAVAMGFHSLGDFNLQMPATTWLFAALLGVSLRGAVWSGTEETEEQAGAAGPQHNPA